MHSSTRNLMIEESDKWVGTVYLWGGNDKTGIDCSHFVWQIYHKFVIKNLPEYFFTQPGLDTFYFQRIKKSELLKGDLIIFPEHIGMVYDPNNQKFIGAQCSTGVAVASYQEKAYWGARVSYYLRCKW